MKLEPINEAAAEFLTLVEASEIAGKSYTWARNKAVARLLTASRRDDGRIVVSSASLRELLAHQAESRPAAAPAPRLVWSNPNLK